jgi:hypothetical protein
MRSTNIGSPDQTRGHAAGFPRDDETFDVPGDYADRSRIDVRRWRARPSTRGVHREAWLIRQSERSISRAAGL